MSAFTTILPAAWREYALVSVRWPYYAHTSIFDEKSPEWASFDDDSTFLSTKID